MKKYKIILLLCSSFFFIQTTLFSQNNSNKEEDGIWTGTVSFLEKQTGKDIVISEWRMEASITNNKGTAVHSFKFHSTNNITSDCKTEDKTELEVHIDYETGTYSIEVPMPGCYGKQIFNGNTTDFSQSDATAISITSQTLKDPNVLEGTITEKVGLEGYGTIPSIRTYTWRLVRSNKVKNIVSKSMPASSNPSQVTGNNNNTRTNNINKSPQQNNNNQQPVGLQHTSKESWTGTINYSHNYIDRGVITQGEYIDEWDYYRNESITINVKGNNKGDASMKHTLNNWQRHTSPFAKGIKAIQIVTEKETGNGKGEVEVWVEMDRPGMYLLKTDGPDYDVDRRARIWSSVLAAAGQAQPESQSTSTNDGLPINIPYQSVGSNPNELSGHYVIYESPTMYTVADWKLKKAGKFQTQTNPNPNSNSSTSSNPNSNPNTSSNPSSNPTQNQQTQSSSVELIVTPENYNDWLPIAGDNAPAPGNKIKTSLLLGGTQPLPTVVKFELKLFSTTSGGMATKVVKPLMDLRFQPQKNAVIADDGQFITIPCTDGRTGEVTIGSYHGSGSSTLIAFAVLADGSRIKGNLFQSLGITEIPIPKRNNPEDK